jgi:hypothetical protein
LRDGIVASWQLTSNDSNWLVSEVDRRDQSSH